ncbi:hypothetical protein MYK68_01290 [Gordonia sp. PP30]|uniref:hypothetical protein n=1 Tax=Gordonia sp. PP30 TaxID=2935861 RepID=UPI001FFE9F1E|nr:hypothetical protein [Gordonia sp. PP30]UQE75303.1 hypothetical protein MYK68_01290 [Gordonia sp. PP30]
MYGWWPHASRRYRPVPGLQPARMWLGILAYLTPVVAAVTVAWRAGADLPFDRRFALTQLAFGPAWIAGLLMMVTIFCSAGEALEVARAAWSRLVERARTPPPQSRAWSAIKLVSDISLAGIAAWIAIGLYWPVLAALGVVCSLAPAWVLCRKGVALYWRIGVAFLTMAMMASLVEIGLTNPASVSSVKILLFPVVSVVLSRLTYWWIGCALNPEAAPV